MYNKNNRVKPVVFVISLSVCTDCTHLRLTNLVYWIHRMFFALLADYLVWHYSTALVHYIRIVRNWWWFITSYFSLILLCKTLVLPFHRMTEPYHRTQSIEELVANVLINILSRLVGLVVRSGTIIAGVSLLLLGTVAGIIGYSLWLIIPMVPIASLTIGTILLINSMFAI